MMPTLNVSGDVLVTEYVSPRLDLLKAGDVVVATKPNAVGTFIIKRIRGMPGEEIWVRPKGARRAVCVVVPQGHVWLEGDNPTFSTDSREYGAVPLALVHGRVLARVWPPGQVGRVDSRVIDHTSAERSLAKASAERSERAQAD